MAASSNQNITKAMPAEPTATHADAKLSGNPAVDVCLQDIEEQLMKPVMELDVDPQAVGSDTEAAVTLEKFFKRSHSGVPPPADNDL